MSGQSTSSAGAAQAPLPACRGYLPGFYLRTMVLGSRFESKHKKH